jgi:hypothetical protein
MKRLFFLLAVGSALSGCMQVTKITYSSQSYYVYDSYWRLIMRTPDEAAKEVVLEGDDILAQVAAYNASHTDSQYFIMEAETDIADAPEAQVYIVDPVTYTPIKAILGVPRSELIDNASSWDLECRADGGVMFVDCIPPAPVPQDTTYQYYLYLLASDGTVLFFEQCTPETFPYMLNAYYLQAYDYPGSTVVHGELVK